MFSQTTTRHLSCIYGTGTRDTLYFDTTFPLLSTSLGSFVCTRFSLSFASLATQAHQMNGQTQLLSRILHRGVCLTHTSAGMRTTQVYDTNHKVERDESKFRPNDINSIIAKCSEQ